MTLSSDLMMDARTEALIREQKEDLCRSTDHLFAGVMLFQWIAGIIVAVVQTPRSWAGEVSQTHFHVWAAIFIGGAFTSLPVFLALSRPGKVSTRHIIAGAQMLMSALLIHLTNGRNETHFHIFGSLAILAFYREWRILLTASIVIFGDHLIRGMYFPQSVYGIVLPAPWRAIEHASWVIFEVTFLCIAIQQSKREMFAIAVRHARLEDANHCIERTVAERTRALTREISDRWDAESKLKIAVARAQEMSRTTTDFLSTAAHELRTPLTSIRGFSELLLSRKLPENKQFVLLRTINEQSTHLSTLVNDMLDLTRIENGNVLSLRYRAVDLIAMVVAAARTFQKINAKHCYTIETAHACCRFGDYDEGTCSLEPLFVRCDGEKIGRVIQNLLSNSTKYSPNGGEVRVRLVSDGIRTTCEVIDHGNGMSPAQVARVFEKFYRADASNTAIEGTGLGMSIVKAIVEQHNGTITVESETGAGTRVTFVLPNAGKEGTHRYASMKPAEPEPAPQQMAVQSQSN